MSLRRSAASPVEPSIPSLVVGTAESNPGCPRCGYVGWVPAEQDEDDEIMEGSGQLRSFADLPLRRFWLAG
jgi:hypothetical protein